MKHLFRGRILNLMKKKNINVYLQVNENISEINFNKITSNKNKDICTIIGIFLDNALEAAIDTPQKSVSIVIVLKEKSKLLKLTKQGILLRVLIVDLG